MTIDPNGVTSFLLVRQPYTSSYEGTCPACGCVSDYLRRVEYTEQKRHRIGGTDHITMVDPGSHDPHLVVTCGQCGFWWECEVWIP